MDLGQYRPATVACCNCGRPMDGTTGLVTCVDCLKLTANIAKDVPREANVQFCRNCERFLMPPQSWLQAQPESRELLALLLRRLPGLNKVRLVDAAFVWTEPHSRRIRIKVAVQGEAAAGVILQEAFEVEYVVIATQCPDCAKSFTVHTWRAAVQLRQKVQHKRTFFYLEQLILKHQAHGDCVSIKESRDGIDFFFAHPNHAIKFIDFINTVAPIKSKRSEQLISHDTHSGSSQFKFTHSVEIAPICRDDLVVLPKAIAHKMSQISRVVLCSRISSSIQFLDFNTLQTADLPANVFWREPFNSLTSHQDLVEFVVLDNEPLGPIYGRNVLSDITVARSADMTQSFVVRSQLGAILHPGDSVMGYYLVNCNFNSDEWDSLAAGERPDIVLVKKVYPNRRRNRNWKLRRMAKEHNEMDAATIDKVENDYEMFLRELEEDQELRGTVNLYKDRNAPQHMDADDDGPQIDVSELLDDLEDLSLNE